ncbi:MAG: DUF4905 domain-containing protein [Bacteroidetes bacterium]|nr:MAG: DUF4905 domain-containing protein [Bacteroidota bacterium]
MNLLKIFERPKLHASWSYQTEGVIWRVLPSASVLIGEERNLDSKQVSFFCLDATTGTPLWEHLTFDEQWWISIEHVHNNVLFFHEFATPDLPDHKKIRAVQLDSGKTLWTNDEVQFAFAQGTSVYVTKTGFEDRHYFEADLLTGVITREISYEEFAKLQSTSEPNDTDLTFSETYDGTQSWMSLLKGAIVKSLQNSVQTDYIEYGELFIFSIYLAESPTNANVQTYNQQLIIVDKTGKQMFHEMLNTGMMYPVPDTLVCRGDMVYYIKNKTTLSAVHVQ